MLSTKDFYMVRLISKTGERMVPGDFKSKEEYLMYLRHLFAYEFAATQIPKNSFVLEIGCGTGYGTKLLSRSAKRIIGLDVDKDTINYTSREYGLENCVFELYDGIKIPYPNNVFDTVVSFQALEHIQDDINIVSEIHRVLKKKGIFILTTPNRTYRLKPGQKPLNKFHVREYSFYELDNLLKNKFPNVRIWGIRGNEEVQRIEIDRIKIGSFVPLELRKLIPGPLKPIVLRMLKRCIQGFQKTKSDKHFLQKYSLKDYYLIKNNIVKDSLDLLGICEK